MIKFQFLCSDVFCAIMLFYLYMPQFSWIFCYFSFHFFLGYFFNLSLFNCITTICSCNLSSKTLVCVNIKYLVSNVNIVFCAFLYPFIFYNFYQASFLDAKISELFSSVLLSFFKYNLLFCSRSCPFLKGSWIFRSRIGPRIYSFDQVFFFFYCWVLYVVNAPFYCDILWWYFSFISFRLIESVPSIPR